MQSGITDFVTFSIFLKKIQTKSNKIYGENRLATEPVAADC